MDVEIGPETSMDIAGRAIGIAIEDTETVHERGIVPIPVPVPGIAVEIYRVKGTAAAHEKSVVIARDQDPDRDPGTALVIKNREAVSEN
jgi:hypothetical protein